jgi:CBS domain-containing protein
MQKEVFKKLCLGCPDCNEDCVLLGILSNTKASQLMNRELIVASPDWPLARVRSVIKEKRIGGLPVVDSGGKILGLITPDDINEALLSGKGEAQASEFMARQLITVSPDESFWDVFGRFSTHHKGRLPVVDDSGTLLGIITRRDLICGMLNLFARVILKFTSIEKLTRIEKIALESLSQLQGEDYLPVQELDGKRGFPSPSVRSRRLQKLEDLGLIEAKRDRRSYIEAVKLNEIGRLLLPAISEALNAEEKKEER